MSINMMIHSGSNIASLLVDRHVDTMRRAAMDAKELFREHPNRKFVRRILVEGIQEARRNLKAVR